MIGDNDIEYLIDNGAIGILCPNVSVPENTYFDIEGKPGKSILINVLSQNSFNEVLDLIQKDVVVEIYAEEAFQIVNSKNLIAKIQGSKNSKEYLIISSHLDGLGKAADGTYYAGARDGASGTAMLLELARIIKEQKNLTNKTIIFTLWDNEQCGRTGKQFYIDNPIYPLSKTSIIYLNNLGGNNAQPYNIGAKGIASGILRDKFARYVGKVAAERSSVSVDKFLKGGAVAISVENMPKEASKDTIDFISKERLSYDMNFMLQYLKREVYGDIFGKLFNTKEVMIITFILLAILFIYLINLVNRKNPDFKIYKVTIEDIFYSTSFGLLEKAFYYFKQLLIILILVVAITNLPWGFNVYHINGALYTNFSLNQVIGGSLEYLRGLFTHGLGQGATGEYILNIISYAYIRSFKLLLAVIVTAIIIGTIKGIMDAYKNNGRSTIRKFRTIMLFSIPDVLIVMLVQLLFIFFNDQSMFEIPREYLDLKRFVYTYLSTVLLPTIYVARIASIAVHEEMNMGYIKAAKAKGLSNFFIIKNHLLKGVLIKVIQTLPSILSLIITNLIIAEYISFYPGIAYNMWVSYKAGDTIAYTGFALALCFLYIIYVMMFKLISYMINPMKGGK